jgi:hypothetical protein
VDEPDPEALLLDDRALGEKRAKSRLVHVPVDGGDGRELAKLLEHRRGREVADVHDRVRRSKDAQALVWQPPGAARKVRVAEDRDQEPASRKRPSR